MSPILIFLIGAAVGGIVVWFLVKGRTAGGRKKELSMNIKRAEEKEKAKVIIVGLLAERGEIANNDVERLLGVSDATATNYLQELEDEGKIEQIGQTGAAVRYRIKSNPHSR